VFAAPTGARARTRKSVRARPRLGSRGAFDPEWYIDISAVWEQKLHALAAHQSQTPAHWTELIRRHNAFYGARCNRAYAEGFRRLPLAFVNNLPAYEYLPS
jgi:LmbE family N-acetylglucosaminyl deacetylase